MGETERKDLIEALKKAVKLATAMRHDTNNYGYPGAYGCLSVAVEYALKILKKRENLNGNQMRKNSE